MLELGIQSQNVIEDARPEEGCRLLRDCGFHCVDFSLNTYLSNLALYEGELNPFFDKSTEELFRYFAGHRNAFEKTGLRVHQLHMPYPVYIPGASQKQNEYLWNRVAPGSLELAGFFGCKNVVLHGFKLKHLLGSEELEWRKTEEFIRSLAERAIELGITLCLENIYNAAGGHIIEGPGCDAEKACVRIDRLNAEYGAELMGFCFDTGHANLVGLDMEGFLSMLGGRLKLLHIHDNDGAADLHQLPFTFTRTRENRSSTDWEGFLSGLREARFRGVLSFETAPVLKAFPRPMKEDALRVISAVGRYFAGELERDFEAKNEY